MTTNGSVTTVGSGISASYSPDGKRLAWLADPDGNGTFELVIAGPTGGSPVTIAGAWPVKYINAGAGIAPQWSPDGTKIAVATASPTGDPWDEQLHVITVATGADAPISGLGAFAADWIEWSDGGYLGILASAGHMYNFDGKAYVVAPGSSTAGPVLGPTPPVPVAPKWTPGLNVLSMAQGADTMVGAYSEWKSWSPVSDGAYSPLSECSLYWEPAEWLPAGPSGEPTRAIGWFRCPDGEGLYLVNTAVAP